MNDAIVLPQLIVDKICNYVYNVKSITYIDFCNHLGYWDFKLYKLLDNYLVFDGETGK